MEFGYTSGDAERLELGAASKRKMPCAESELWTSLLARQENPG